MMQSDGVPEHDLGEHGMSLGPAQNGLHGALGVVIDEVSAERTVVHVVVDDRHMQPFGVVHGGLYAVLAETGASIGAITNARQRHGAKGVLGLENHSSFLRMGKLGDVLTAEAVPRQAGRRAQTWTVTIRNQEGVELALGTVRFLVIR